MPAMGKKIPILERVGEAYKRERKWFQKAKLTCGHIVTLDLGEGLNHRNNANRKTGYCIQCLVKEVEY